MIQRWVKTRVHQNIYYVAMHGSFLFNYTHNNCGHVPMSVFVCVCVGLIATVCACGCVCVCEAVSASMRTLTQLEPIFKTTDWVSFPLFHFLPPTAAAAAANEQTLIARLTRFLGKTRSFVRSCLDVDKQNERN